MVAGYKKIDDGNTITITKGRKTLYFKLNPTKNRAALIFRNKLLYEYKVKAFEHDVRKTLVYDKIPPRTAKQIIQARLESNSVFEFHQDVENLCFSLLSAYHDPSDHFNYDRKEIVHDLGMFKNDLRFLKLLDLVSKKYVNLYKEFAHNIALPISR